jgi:hypothetical protein
MEKWMDNGPNKHKIRPFDWRDLLLMQRLQGQGQILDYKRAGVDGIFPLRDALHNYLTLRTSARRTLVMASKNAFAQYICYKGSKRVRLTYLVPTPTRAQDADCWIDLLEQLTATVGKQGIYHIVTEARHDGPELELLQRIGFGVFTRQVLCRRESPLVQGDLPPLPGLRPWRSTDDWGARLLYTNVVPQLAQQIEAPVADALTPSLWTKRLVLERDGEILACLVSRVGRVGSALRLLTSPQASAYAQALIQHGLATLSHAPGQPVYCRVRRYADWLQAPLEACGFEPLTSTVLLVKHTVARVITPAWNRLPLVEGQTEMRNPIVSNFQTLDTEQTGVD